jgi:CRISPR system Cascade subunit CasA
MPYCFNLSTDPFVPSLPINGKPVEYGLRDVLVNAHEIAELRDDSPLVTIALHRLLLAILHRCYLGPKNPAERVAIHKAGRFDEERIVGYLKKFAERFDLFDDRYPFFQRAGFTTKEPSAINRLSQELARGNNATLFDHSTDDPAPRISPARAARWLIAEQAFAVGGGKSDTGNTTHAPLVSGAIVLARGDTLFETLWLNLTVFSNKEPVSGLPDDAPAWERTGEEPQKQPGRPKGYLDYLTWQSRTLHLHPEEFEGQVVVRRVSYAQGRKLEAGPGFFDPMIAFHRRDKKEPFVPVRFNEFRELWRDSAALFQVSEQHQEYDRAPTCVHTLTAPQLEEVLPRSARYRLSVFGLCTDKAKVSFWRHETLPLRLAYLDHPELVEALKGALALAEAVARDALRGAAWAAVANWLTASPEMKPDTDRVRDVVDSYSPERLYWSQLERPFREFLLALADENADIPGCAIGWYWVTLHRAATAAFDNSIGRIDGGRDLKAVNVGRGQLFSRLKKIRNDNRIPDRTKEGAA